MNEQSSNLAPHQLGRYRLVTTLGQGGMGTIWLAVASGLGEFRKLLVIKELRWDLTRNSRFVEMFLDEAKLAARLSHPNVVQTLEAGEEGGRYFLSMEFLDGQPLSEVMARAAQEPAFSLAVRLRILCGALAGLHYAHDLKDYDGTELHIVHRDVSPHNVFVTYDGQVKVVDFGIAKAADAESSTQPGIFKGKFAYASPEQIKGQPVDRRADVFAMGVLLWELVTLQRFARGKLTQEAFDARLQGREPRLSQVDPDVEPLLAEICDRAMHIDPSQRFASAEEMRIAIEQYLFVSGERVDASTIAAIMRKAFAGERATMHRMIDGHLKEANYGESLVRQLRPAPAPDDPTTVADLSELVQSSRDDEKTPSQEVRWESMMPKPNRSKRWLAAGIALALVAIAVYALPKLSDEPAAITTTELAPSAPAPQPIAPPSAPAPAPELKTEREAARVPASVRVRDEAATAPAPAPKSQRTPGFPTPASMFGVPDLDGPAPRPFSERMEDEDVADAPRAASKHKAQPAAPAGAHDPVEMGGDLRSLRKEGERRALDLEDPFR